MRIVNIEAIPLWASFAEAFGTVDAVPVELRHPAFGMRRIPLAGQGCILVRIETDDGLVGIGEAMARPGPTATASYINDILAPMLVGADPRQIEVHWTAMSEQLSFAPMAVSGVDIALWDPRGQITREPMYQVLGGPFRTEIDCYASPVPYLPDPDASAAKATEFVADGFIAVKLKIGRGVEVDLEHVAVVRAAIGPRVKLLVDCNGAYTLAESVRLGRGLVRHDVYWLEEPVHRQFRDDLAEVRRRIDLPLASGEWLDSIWGFRDLLDASGADILMPNVTRCGGLTGFRRIAEMAALRNVTIAPHGVGSGILAALHGCAAISNFTIYEYNQLFNPLRHGILADPLRFGDGKLQVPTTPGLGVSIDDASLDRFG
ncbi:MAG: mandelate racemase/muconate lactonizing enzyme family protein, partial [Chloroflexota bacterium]|nr:mandelate racemase/muconate lactonizing enzyme family protein [Chloroflexota bacterium]